MNGAARAAGAGDGRFGPAPASGETDLERLLAGLRPELGPEVYAFCTLPGAGRGALPRYGQLAAFQEEEGLSLVLEKERAAAAGLERSGDFRRITLAVRSSLDAVGLTAAVSARLADGGIAANVVAAYHHDHVFVPADRAEEALALLQALARGTDGRGTGERARAPRDGAARPRQPKPGRSAGSEETP